MNLTIKAEPVNLNGKVQTELTALDGDRKLHTDRIDLFSSQSRKRFLTELERKGVNQEDRDGVERQLVDLGVQLRQEANEAVQKDKGANRDSLLADIDVQAAEALAAMPAEIIQDAELTLSNKRLIDLILCDIATIGVVGEKELALSVYLVGTSRLLNKPLAGIVHGLSSSGKSFTIDATASLFPRESIFMATDTTANALYYLDPGSLMHKFVVAGERSRKQDDDRAEATRALREMLASGELRKAVPFNDGKRLHTVCIWQPGPIAYVESTTLTVVFDEDANRCLALSSDESSEQTERVVDAVADRAMRARPDTSRVSLVHHAMQRLLRRVHVVIPYADKLADAMPKQRPQARRAITHALDMIRAVAVLHQRQRADGELQHGDTIQAAVDDYVIARRLLIGPLGRALGGEVSPAVANFGKRLRELYGDDAFTPAQASRDDKILSSRGKVNEYLRGLADVGAAECVDEHKGSKPSRWKMVGEPVVSGAAWLPKVDEKGNIV